MDCGEFGSKKCVSGRGLKIQIMSNSRGPKLEKANQVFCCWVFFVMWIFVCLFGVSLVGWLVFLVAGRY